MALTFNLKINLFYLDENKILKERLIMCENVDKNVCLF